MTRTGSENSFQNLRRAGLNLPYGRAGLPCEQGDEIGSKFWVGKRVAVTGGAGFVGSHVVEQLVARGAQVTVVDNFSHGQEENLQDVRSSIATRVIDLCELEPTIEAFESQEVVLHLAAKVAGVAYNQEHPAEMFRENAQMALNVLEAARRARVARVEIVSTACVYPRDCRIPTPETEGFRDDPEPSNLGYGWAKRLSEVQARLYAAEYGMAIGIVRPYNTYGPRDHFDPKISHVIPALILRVMSGEDPVVVWGDGEQSRAFLYVEDFARGVLEAAERYPQPDPVNLGTPEEIKIKDLIALIAELSGTQARIVFDRSRPAGQPRRNCDTAKAERLIGFKARIRLREGLERTLAWYQSSIINHQSSIHRVGGIACVRSRSGI